LRLALAARESRRRESIRGRQVQSVQNVAAARYVTILDLAIRQHVPACRVASVARADTRPLA